MKTISRDSNTFYCFSPAVMMATFLIEAGLLLYVLIRYRMNSTTRLVAGLLLSLAIFQLAEYNVCAVAGSDSVAWSRIGFMSITLLPALGIHFIYVLAGKKWNNITGAAYGMSLAFIGVFAFSERAFSGHVCAGNYAIFQMQPPLGTYYFLYYYLWLFIGVYLCIRFISASKNKAVRKSLTLFGISYLVLLIPTLLANMVKPETIGAIPSIMCGFAIVLAGTISLGIMPKLGDKRRHTTSKKPTKNR